MSISKMTSDWISWDQLSQQIQPFSSPSGSRRLAQTFSDMLGPVIQFWHAEPDKQYRSRIQRQTRIATWDHLLARVLSELVKKVDCISKVL